MIDRRREQVERYRQILADIPGLALPPEPAWARSNWQSFCVRLPEHCEQRSVMQRLLDAGIATRRGIMCAHRELAYLAEPWSCGAGPGACGCAPGICRRLQHSEQAQDRSILLPLFHQMTERDQDRVAAALREACTE
jgi:dTDP-4-amino-4,6-dideoxygalactose transaminase